MNRQSPHCLVVTPARKSLWGFLYGTLLLCLLVLVWGQGTCSAAPSIPTPLWMERTAIASEMVINGLPSEVQSFEADRDLEKTLSFYRQRWGAGYNGRAGYREVETEHWHVISRLEGRYLMTVQAREKNGFITEGFLAIADLKRIEDTSSSDAHIPKMSGSRVINRTTNYDPGKKGRTVMVVNPFSVTTNSGFYLDHYLGRGWGQLQNREFNGAQVLAFRRLGEEAHIVIRESGKGSVMVLNLVESN